MKQEKSCGCIIIKQDQVLLVQGNKGSWTFPKGHVDEGESEIETALREVKEETNLDVEIISDKRYTTSYIVKNDRLKEVVYFIAKPLTADIKYPKDEILDCRYFKINEAKTKLVHEELIAILENAIKDYRR